MQSLILIFELNLLSIFEPQTILIVVWTLTSYKAFTLVLNDIRKQAMAKNHYQFIVLAILHNPSAVVSTNYNPSIVVPKRHNPSSELFTYQSSFVVVVAYQSSSIIMIEDKAKAIPSYKAMVKFESALTVH